MAYLKQLRNCRRFLTMEVLPGNSGYILWVLRFMHKRIKKKIRKKPEYHFAGVSGKQINNNNKQSCQAEDLSSWQKEEVAKNIRIWRDTGRRHNSPLYPQQPEGFPYF
jgi:hypothetical protein